MSDNKLIEEKPKPKSKPKSKTKPKAKKRSTSLIIDPITFTTPLRPVNPDLPKNYYFDNLYVEKLLTEYVKGGCTDTKLRDMIMDNASELIRQIIRTHKLHLLGNGKEGATFGDLYQIAWCQVESSLYKFDYQPGHTKVFNMWCVAPGTMLLTDHGFDTIGNMLYSGTGINDEVYGIDGFNGISATLCRPATDTLKVKTRLGYEIEVTPEHRLYVLKDKPEWVEASKLFKGDLVGIQYGQKQFVGENFLGDIELNKGGEWNQPEFINEELAYMVGLYVAEGSWSYGKLVIYNIDQDIVDILVNNNLGLNFIHEPEQQRISLCNVRFIEFLNGLGLEDHSRSWKKFIPKRALKWSENIIDSLLRGLFDGDGYSSIGNGEVGYSSTSIQLINQLRMILLNKGYLTKIQVDNREFSEFDGVVRKRKKSWQIILSTYYSKKFYGEVGFGLARKAAKKSYLPNSKVEIFGVADSFKNLYTKYGPGSLGYNKIRPALKNTSGICFLETTENRIKSWSEWNDDDSYNAIIERLDERTRDRNNVVWLPIVSITPSVSPVCEITVDSPNHSYIANGFISHNSQVAKTVMLAHIKKESRDKRNGGAYKEHLDSRNRPKNYKLQRFVDEVKEICKYNEDHVKIIESLEDLISKDNRPHDGLIDKLVKRSGLPRSKVSSFLRTIRLRSFEFTDAPVNEKLMKPGNKHRVMNANFESDDDQ